jgi:hypothetical protein
MNDISFESRKKRILSIHSDCEIVVKWIWDLLWDQDMITKIGQTELGILGKWTSSIDIFF